MTRCPNCNKELYPSDTFCSRCRVPVNSKPLKQNKMSIKNNEDEDLFGVAMLVAFEIVCIAIFATVLSIEWQGAMASTINFIYWHDAFAWLLWILFCIVNGGVLIILVAEWVFSLLKKLTP